ncbi:hypothetical protein [Lactobacillus sp. Sy-1]|uniref:hypothetical protein n=1 Tax=Lactobacillus sp. Sy-1 TaxID=2109645 RepID=UPI001C59D288|nr:hypothetical protein [Lactobacillus sp. Sy-1]MBW1605182.1 hypothetical protein [Lactobacillus sp. Sy-1]
MTEELNNSSAHVNSRHQADSSKSMTLADKQAELRKFVSLSDIQLQALIDRISPDARSRKVMQEDLAKQSNLMKSQIEKVTSIQEADQLYEKFENQFKQ